MTAIGIDLGTTNSCAAVWRSGQVTVIRDPEGHLVTPSVVSARAQAGAAENVNGEWVAGMRALRDQASNPRHCYRWVKRLVGRRFEDDQVALLQHAASYEIAAADNGEAWIVGRERLHSPAELSALILRRLAAAAKIALGKTVTKVVITVPAYFNNAQRTATQQAGEIAGLEVLRIINEPTAAALALELDRHDEPITVAMYDLGGGTFDLSVLRISAEGELEVMVSNGDTFLGGEDFDRAVVDHLAEQFKAIHGVDPRDDILARARLKEAAELAKCELSFSTEVEVNLDTFMVLGVEQKPVPFHTKLDRATLERLTVPLVDRTIGLCAGALQEAGLDTTRIDRVVLVGGQTRMPLVQQLVGAFFGRATVEAPDPDQIVARGAAVMAAALTGQMAVELEDVTPFALGVQAADGRMVTLVEAQAKIPVRRTAAFTTVEPEQDAVTIRLRQGNSDQPSECLPLGLFHLEGIRPDKAGRRIIDVTADVDADGTMTASARDRGSGKVQPLTVDTMGLSPRAVERMAKLQRASSRATTSENDDGSDQSHPVGDAPAGAQLP